METNEVKAFYEKNVGGSHNKYEFNRWSKSSQGRASYVSTKDALHTHAIPLLKKGDVVLEVGPGPGTWTKEIIQNADIESYDIVDISEEMLKQAKENLGSFSQVKYINSDILDFQPEKKYDFFFSSRFIEYVPNKAKVISIIKQSIKPGCCGYIVTKTPQYKRLFSKRNKAPVHQGQIAHTEFSRLLEEGGFEVIKLVNVTSVFPGLRNGFLDRVLTKFCHLLPFGVSKYFSESYAIVFKENDS